MSIKPSKKIKLQGLDNQPHPRAVGSSLNKIPNINQTGANEDMQ